MIHSTSLLDSISPRSSASPQGPHVQSEHCAQETQRCWQALTEEARHLPLLERTIEHPSCVLLVSVVAGYSPYLARLILNQPLFFAQACQQVPDETLQQVLLELRNTDCVPLTQTEMMHLLRLAKQKIALLVAMMDIAHLWDVMVVTKHLSDFADLAVQKACDFLMLKAQARGEISLPDIAHPQTGCGLLVLGMGKLGAFELNYSSDIDLIILFDRDRAPYIGPRDVQSFFTKFAQELTALLQERTSDGYVFRTDLRLRPDPRSTPLAISLSSAITYYETLGQNWERAAMIKARQVAGDPECGHYFEEHIIPYIWRKHLDFATIADIHSIKRQMNAKVGEAMQLAGHNIKLGRGGIREIEFYAQTQQLVWGGRYPQLRTKPTLQTLHLLADADIISQDYANIMHEAYVFLRRVEHYLQMIDDQQTHTLPETPEGIFHLAGFLGYENVAEFEAELLKHLHSVHTIYTDSMEGTPPLAIDGNLVFTGVEADPETLKTLERMGYKHAESVSDLIQSWHRGSRRATRGKKARQVLTELTPNLLLELADTANPDQAFFRFDDFLTNLPAGLQIFSLLQANTQLLDLLAHIMGSAPALSEILGKHPHMLDIVLQGDFYRPMPSKAQLDAELRQKLLHTPHYEDALSELRRYKHERQFQAGIQMLRGLTKPYQIGDFLSNLADVLLEHTIRTCKQEFAKSHGEIIGSGLAVIALGKLGSRELTFGSDLDLTMVYQTASQDAMSDGAKAVDVKTYYSRLSSRIINACTLLTQEGFLYEVDTRLRPLGADGPLAAQMEGFDEYFSKMAWVFEFMALTRARIIYADSNALKQQLEGSIAKHLAAPREPITLLEEVRRMRQKMFDKYATQNPWDVKHVRGGSVDVDFIAQYLVLRYANAHPELIKRNAPEIFAAASQAGILNNLEADNLTQAHYFLCDMLSFLRLCNAGSLIEMTTPSGLKKLLAERFEAADFETLKARLIETEAYVLRVFNALT